MQSTHNKIENITDFQTTDLNCLNEINNKLQQSNVLYLILIKKLLPIKFIFCHYFWNISLNTKKTKQFIFIRKIIQDQQDVQ